LGREEKLEEKAEQQKREGSSPCPPLSYIGVAEKQPSYLPK
jgi:hypothetical protein